MLETDDKYFTCPYCGLVLAFNYVENTNLYQGKCPHCGNILDMSCEEFETNDIEKYFEFEE